MKAAQVPHYTREGGAGAGPCQSKRAYPTHDDAYLALGAIVEDPTTIRPELLDAYRCGQCPSWHIGNGRTHATPGGQAKVKTRIRQARARALDRDSLHAGLAPDQLAALRALAETL